MPDGCDALSCSARSLDPAAYVELWLKDAGLHGGADYRRPLRRLAGLVRRAGRRGRSASAGSTCAEAGGDAHAALEDWPYDVEQPIGPAIARLGAPRDRAAPVGEHDRLTSSRVDVVQETIGAPGAEDPETIVLRQQRGLRRARQVDTVEAALVGACDGELTVGQILDALAELARRGPGELRAAYLPVVRELVVEGFLRRLTTQTIDAAAVPAGGR